MQINDIEGTSSITFSRRPPRESRDQTKSIAEGPQSDSFATSLRDRLETTGVRVPYQRKNFYGSFLYKETYEKGW